jgi:hypothetical protein
MMGAMTGIIIKTVSQTCLLAIYECVKLSKFDRVTYYKKDINAMLRCKSN